MDFFSCCLPRKRSQINRPDERTYLIPTEPQPDTVEDEITRRQRALQDRLTDIVRAKEGKMVNLHVRLPFNLHNRTNSSLSTRLDPSSSRSASDSLLASPTPTSPRYPISYAINQHQYHYTSPLGFVDERHSSASRSSSCATPGGGRFPHDNDQEHDSEVGAGGGGEGSETGGPRDDRTPILNLRLVNPNPSLSFGFNNNKPLLVRGRSPLKYATTLETEQLSTQGVPPSSSSTLPPPPPPPPQSPRSDVTEPGEIPFLQVEDITGGDVGDVKSPSSTVGPSVVNPKTPEVDHIHVSISPASIDSFKIQETTPLVLDWES